MMLIPPIFHVEQIDRAELNRWLIDWGHRMGPYTRPSFAIEAHHALFFHGQPVAVTAASQCIGEVVADTGLGRDEVVELARLCAARPDLCRVMLRLWREGIFPDIARAHGRQFAISYQDEALHSGNTYRFDGWVSIGRSRSGTDRRSGRAGRTKTIWGWPREVSQAVGLRKTFAGEAA